MKKAKGFTLIELLVVIAIIGLLSSVVIVSLNNARMKSRDAKRLADLKEMQKALELYASDHNGRYPVNTSDVNSSFYPHTFSYVGTNPVCYGALTVSYGAAYLYRSPAGVNTPDPLAPKYIPTLPRDPKPFGSSCYIYASDGVNYKFLVYQTVESFDPAATGHPLADPARPNSFRVGSDLSVYNP